METQPSSSTDSPTIPQLQLGEPDGIRRTEPVEPYNDGSDSEDEGPLFNIPAIAPQLEGLAIPSPLFMTRSFANLLDPEDSRPRSRANSSLRGSMLESHHRVPTLNFSNPRAAIDNRIRRPGRTEEVFLGRYPDDNEALDLGDDYTRWSDLEWTKIGAYILEKGGYKIDTSQQNVLGAKLAVRASDQLPLFLHVAPVDDSSYELDIVEMLSANALRAKAMNEFGVVPLVPVVGLLPLSDGWTAVLTERWELLSKLSIEQFPTFAKHLAGVVAFAHSNHVAHLSLSKESVGVSSTVPVKYSLHNWGNSVETDPFTKGGARITGISGEAFAAPEMSETVPYDPYPVDVFALGRVLEETAKELKYTNNELASLVKSLTADDPSSRPIASAVVASLRAIFP